MASPVVFVLVLTAIIFETVPVCSQTSGVIYVSENPIPVGSNVTLFSTNSITTGAWLFNNQIILIIVSGSGIISHNWTTRTSYNSTTSSLTIRSLTLSDSGVYTLDDLNSFSAQLTLSVQVPISNVTLKANATNLVEFNDTAIFTCSILNGSFPSYVWMNGSSVVTAGGNVQLSGGNATLTIANVTRYDTGPFTCNVSNGVSYEVSPPVLLNISYGPSNTVMKTVPAALNNIFKTGSNITLTCAAQSKPPATIMWMINNMYLNQFGPQLQLQNVTLNNSANYTCISYNTVTFRFNSASLTIKIMDPLAAAALSHTSGPAIINKSFTLYCNVTGTADIIQWLWNGQLLSAGNTTSMPNNTLIFSLVQKSNGGNYQCQAFNAVSNVTSSPYNVIVNYGPEKPSIMGPNAAKTGDNITLTCNASSYPPSSYMWFFSGALVANTSNYTTPPLTTNMSGIYTCMAYNTITGLNSTATKQLTVLQKITNVQVNAPHTRAIKGFQYQLTCNVTGPVDHIFWMMNGHPLTGNSTTEFLTNNTIFFNPVQQNNTGHYKCVAMNAAEHVTSPPYMLLVNFGPDTPIIEGPELAETGQSVVFNCSAMSMPPSQISWWFNNTLVSNTSVFMIDQLSLNMSGEYVCMAFNNVTGLNNTNMLMLTVIEALMSVMIKNNTVPIDSNNFTLICNVTGSYLSIEWLKNNQTLNMTTSANVTHYIEGNMLYFTPVTTEDDGIYQCVATNGVAELQSPQYNLLVNYGPLNVTITGPNSAKQDDNVCLTCSANCQPNCEFQWYFSSSSQPPVFKKTGPVMAFSATNAYQGNYTCQARNPVTNNTVNTTKAFTVIVPGQASAIGFPAHSGVMLMLMGVFALSLFVLFN